MAFATNHDRYLAAWETAFRLGDTTDLERFPAPSYQGFFGHAGVTMVEPVDREESIQGVRLFSRALRGASARAEGRTVRMRSETEAVVTFERIIEREGAPVAVYAVMQSWRKAGEAWLVVRETAEHIK
ncbi:MAG TPA: hypothetical protein VNT01_13020 [Symbiobacteriaceae bacterium]|nr:hypothetical protein [Symbiobacteriaceae bacterium]